MSAGRSSPGLPRQTLDVQLAWNHVEGYTRALENIVNAPNEFYVALGRGVDYATKKYGGMEDAMAIGGNEVSGYHTGPASIVGQLVGVRHSHRDNGGYDLDRKAVKKPMNAVMMVDEIIKEDDSRGAFNSLVGCLFARGVCTSENIIDPLGALGIEKTKDDPDSLGKLLSAPGPPPAPPHHGFPCLSLI